MNIIFDNHEFSKPTRIAKWEPPKAAGLYVILKPDLSSSPIPLKPIYFGQTRNFAERGLLKSHEICKWVKEAESEDGVFILCPQLLVLWLLYGSLRHYILRKKLSKHFLSYFLPFLYNSSSFYFKTPL